MFSHAIQSVCCHACVACVWHVLLACWVPLEAPVAVRWHATYVALPRADAGAQRENK